MILARWFPPGSARLLIRRGQAARALSTPAQHPLASEPGGKREEARLAGGGGRLGRAGPGAAHFLFGAPTTTLSCSGPPEPGRWRSPALRVPTGVPGARWPEPTVETAS